MPLTPQFLRNLERFRLVTFDITDTLLKFKRSPGIQYSETASKFGYPNLDHEKILQSFRLEYKFLTKNYPNYGRNIPNMGWNQWWIQLVSNVLTSIDKSIPEKDKLEIAKELVRIYRTDKCWLHIDGAVDIVSKVKECGKTLGVISNFDGSLPFILEAMNLNQFDFIITAYDYDVLKPTRKIFDLALEKANTTSEQALHIGNLHDVDYMGARAAGWSSLLIAKMTDQEMAKKKINKEYVYSCLHDLLQALECKDIKWD